jgi:hypothetical protein
MSVIQVSGPFSVELYGEVHPPHGTCMLELCALLFGDDTPVPFAFTSTSASDHSRITGLVTQDRCGEYATIEIDVAKLNVACTRLVIATHVEELDKALRRRTGAMAINPTLKRFTYSARTLGFGHSASFMDEDCVYGVHLLTLVKRENGWSLDEQSPTTFPELVEFAWDYGGIELNPWPA